MSNKTWKYLANRILCRHLVQVLGSVVFPGILLTWWVSTCLSHLHPRKCRKVVVHFSHNGKKRSAEDGSARGSRGAMGEELCPCPPSLHPSRTRGWFHHSPRWGVTWEGMQGCSWTMLPNSSARRGFLQLLWGNSPISPKWAQQIDKSWPPLRCAVSLRVLNRVAGFSWVKPAAPISKKMRCFGGSRQNTTAKSLGMHFKLQSVGKKGCKANRANPCYTHGRYDPGGIYPEFMPKLLLFAVWPLHPYFI